MYFYIDKTNRRRSFFHVNILAAAPGLPGILPQTRLNTGISTWTRLNTGLWNLLRENPWSDLYRTACTQYLGNLPGIWVKRSWPLESDHFMKLYTSLTTGKWVENASYVFVFISLAASVEKSSEIRARFGGSIVRSLKPLLQIFFARFLDLINNYNNDFHWAAARSRKWEQISSEPMMKWPLDLSIKTSIFLTLEISLTLEILLTSAANSFILLTTLNCSKINTSALKLANSYN